MNGSEHFRVYEHNLRRILLLDWIRDEQIRRRLALDGARRRREEGRTGARPYWIVSASELMPAAG
jgi:hypothetical protein